MQLMRRTCFPTTDDVIDSAEEVGEISKEVDVMNRKRKLFSRDVSYLNPEDIKPRRASKRLKSKATAPSPPPMDKLHPGKVNSLLCLYTSQLKSSHIQLLRW